MVTESLCVLAGCLPMDLVLGIQNDLCAVNNRKKNDSSVVNFDNRSKACSVDNFEPNFKIEEVNKKQDGLKCIPRALWLATKRLRPQREVPHHKWLPISSGLYCFMQWGHGSHRHYQKWNGRQWNGQRLQGNIKLFWIKAHVGNTGNDKSDELVEDTYIPNFTRIRLLRDMMHYRVSSARCLGEQVAVIGGTEKIMYSILSKIALSEVIYESSTSKLIGK